MSYAVSSVTHSRRYGVVRGQWRDNRRNGAKLMAFMGSASERRHP